MKNALPLILAIGFSAPVLAGDHAPIVLSHHETRFENSSCEATNTCDLRSVQFVAENYKVLVNGRYTYGTRMFAAYETNAVNDLERYAFVQFLRGCHYSANTQSVWPHVIYHFNTPRIFNFPGWVIDSDGGDPIYSSLAGEVSRFAILHWNKETFSFDNETEQYYTQEQPKFPRAYISDRPSGAYFMNGVAQNAAMEFRVCLYRTNEVPIQTRDTDLTFAQPIACFEWSSSFVYNFTTERFESPVGTAVCSQVPAP